MASENLTDRRVAAARAEAGGRLEIFDRNQRGLVLRVTSEGRKSWVVRYRTPDGRQPRMKLGDYPAMSLADARQDAGEVLRAVMRGGDPALDRRRAEALAKAQPLKTFADLATAYFAACRSGEGGKHNQRGRMAFRPSA